MPTESLRDDARRLIELLPDHATWEDVQYLIDVRRSIEAGLADCEAGRLVSTEEVRWRLGIFDGPQI
jgi:hypothetical protein